MEKQTQGLVIESRPFKDYDRIVRAFTPEGLYTIFVKGGNRQTPKGRLLHQLTQPLSLVQWVLREKKGGMYLLIEGNLMDSLIGLRGSYEKLAAGQELQVHLRQMDSSNKPSPLLYISLLKHLSQLQDSENINAILTSFYIKSLIHEGVWSDRFYCAHCSSLIEGTFYWSQEGWCCARHQHLASLMLSDQEVKILSFLASNRSLESLDSLELSDRVKKLASFMLQKAWGQS